MKKRKRQDGMSLDSLLDTMTTVVGILIILLIVLQVGANRAVQEIVEKKKDDNATALGEEALAPIQKEKDTLEAEKAALILRKDEVQKERTLKNKAAAQFEATIEKLEKAIADARPKATQTTALEKELKEAQAAAQTVTRQLKKKETALKSMQALLAKTEKPAASDLSKDVNLPDPREPIKGAKPFYFLCRGGKIYPVNYDSLKAKALAGVKSSKLTPNKEGEYDGNKLAAYLEKNTVATKHFRLKAKPTTDKYIRFYVYKNENAGEDVESLSKPNSAFSKTLAGIDPKKRYLLFHVFSDSFDVYLTARALASKHNLPAGWAPTGRSGDWNSFHWGHKHIGRSKVPPPKPPKPPPAGTKPKPSFPNSVID